MVRSSGGSPSDANEIEAEPVVNNIIDLARRYSGESTTVNSLAVRVICVPAADDPRQ